MPKRRSYTPEQIITKLREAEILLSQGKTVKEASKQLEVSEQTYYRWRREYGGMDVTQAKKLKEIEKELVKAGSSMDKVLKVTIYASNSAYYGTINEVYARYFNENPPARTFVTVASWPMEFDIEIEIINPLPSGRGS